MAKKILAKTGGQESASVSDNIYTFSNAFVVAASSKLSAFVIKAAINHLRQLKEQNIYAPSSDN